MRPNNHADDLTPDQRFQHLAVLLAAGLRRLRPGTTSRAEGMATGCPNIPPELSANCLELSHETRLTVHTG
jgi:hypothetical protein